MDAGVAPYMGAWIETIFPTAAVMASQRSLPIWERGLKLTLLASSSLSMHVAPYMGAWIET